MFVKVAIVLFIIIALFSLTQMMMKYNEYVEKKQNLEKEAEMYRLKIEELESELDAPFDKEYIIKIARQKLNLTLPYTVIFYNDYHKK